MFDSVLIRAVAEYWSARPCNIRHSPRTMPARWHACFVASESPKSTSADTSVSRQRFESGAP